jgi:hypothetical protein
MKKRSRNWILTINYKETEPMTNDKLLDEIKSIDGLVYVAFQFEQGEQGTNHHQIYMSFKHAKSFEVMKKLFTTAHIEPMQGTHQQASDYCTKEESRIGDPVFWGELPQQGKRSDIMDIYEMLVDGCSFTDIRNAFPSQYLLYRDKIHTIKQELLEEKYQDTFRNIKVIYMSDETGIGKTRYVMERYNYTGVFRVSNYKNPFDTYKGESVLVFDEFRSSLFIEQMLNYLDGYPMRLPARYGDKVACYTKVYIVSNWAFKQQYDHEQRYYPSTFQAFERRINFIGSLEEVKAYESNDVAEDDVPW